MKCLVFVFWIISLVFLTAKPAYAYLDPGTGSLIVQTVIAAVIGSLFAIKIYWQKLKAFLLRRKLNRKERVLPVEGEVDMSLRINDSKRS